MRLTSLSVENFRGFESTTLELESDVTLLVGRNATGKTALLDAIAVALGAWMCGTTQARKEDRPLTAADARLVRQESAGLPTANPCYPVRIAAKGTDSLGSTVSWARELRHAGGRTTTGESQSVRGLARRAERAAVADPNAALPLFAYYGTGRLWVQKRDRTDQRARLGARTQGYAASLDYASNHKLFERWMAWRESDRIQQLASAAERGEPVGSVATPHLDAIQHAVRECLEGVATFSYSANHRELRVMLTDGRLLPFDALSDGQRSLAVLAADLAWRSAQLNPAFGADAPSKAEGVVLIDEIELHLHPAWQREVIPRILTAFPRLQFVMTTHSPQVVSTASPHWVRVLTDTQQPLSVSHTRGRDTNALLRDVFGVPDRPDIVRHRVSEIESLLESGMVDEAHKRLVALEHDLGPDDRLVRGLTLELNDLERYGVEGAEGR